MAMANNGAASLHVNNNQNGISHNREHNPVVCAPTNSRANLIRKSQREPYRATRLWMEAVALFRRGIPLGKHRKGLKGYENCFIACEAVTWFQAQLQQTFGTNDSSSQSNLNRTQNVGITRQKTLQLLQKFYKSGIFTNVTASRTSVLLNNNTMYPNSLGFVNETDFKDNGQLYRLTASETDSPTKNGNKDNNLNIAKNNTKVVANNCNNYSVIIRPLTLGQINSLWEQHFIDRFTTIVGFNDVVRTLYKQPNLIPGFWIAHNMTEIGKYGIVKCYKDKDNEDLPKWLLQAMKCLANWPNRHTDEQPNYPGFENDVFKLIVDYFNKTCLNGRGPLLTPGLYDAFITSFIHAELFDFNLRLYSSKIISARNNQPNTTTDIFPKLGSKHRSAIGLISSPAPMFRDEQYPFNASESIENLLLDILTPQTKASRHKVGFIKPRRILSDSVAFEQIEAGNVVPKPMPVQSYNVSRYASAAKVDTSSSCYFYETAFTNDSSPLTRVISKTELQSNLGIKLPLSLNPSQSYAYENPALELSRSEKPHHHHPKYSKILGAPFNVSGENSSGFSSSKSTSYSFCEYSIGDNSTTSNITGFAAEKNVSEMDDDDKEMSCTLPLFKMKSTSFYPPRPLEKVRSFSAVDLSDSFRDRSPYAFSRKGIAFDDDNDDFGNMASLKEKLQREGVRRNLAYYYGADACIPGLMTNEGKQLAIHSFRLLTLLIPPINRRHLQLLFRCMHKMAKNDKLMLDVAMTTRSIVVNTFFKNILYSFDDNQFDELLALRIVTFMMDNDAEIFCLDNETRLIDSVKKKITEEQIIKVPNEAPLILNEKPVDVPKKSSPAPLEQSKSILEPKKDNLSLNTKASIKKSASYSMALDVLSPITHDSLDGNSVSEIKKLTPKSFFKRTPKRSAEPKASGESGLVLEEYENVSDKENRVQYCSRITLNEYEDQKLLGGTAPSLRVLLETILENPKMSKKDKKVRLDQFVEEYPHIFCEKFGDARPEDILRSYTDDSLNDSTKSLEQSTSAQQLKSKNPFNRLFKNLRF